jgi:sulfate adenylyltransferase subunit 1
MTTAHALTTHDSEAPVTAPAHDALGLAPARRHDLLRLATAGSVDDGKSTLVGRLLYDTKSVLADQLDAVERVSRERGLDVADLALLTDGLRAEREQGITIDVAYRYFSTATRSYVLADTPGHVQYTRNMVTGASTAELALILIDARHGVVEQTRRHLAVTGLLGVRHVAVAVNKMDLVDWSQQRFDDIVAEFAQHATRFGIEDVAAVPVSALFGDNVVDRSDRAAWYTGPTLLEHLESVPVGTDPSAQPLRMPVQYVIRPQSAEHRDYRGYAGRLASGVVRPGDEVVVLPGGGRTTIAGIDLARGDGSVESLDVAFAPQSVVLRLTDDLDVSRGDLIAAADEPSLTTRNLSGTVAVLSERPLRQRDRVLVRVGTRTVRALVDDIVDQLDIATMEQRTAPDGLALNAIGRVRLRLADDVAVDDYRALRRTGAFLLIDEADGSTLAAGMADAPDRNAGEGI